MNNIDYWDKVMKLKDAGRLEADGDANKLSRFDVDTILATADFFGSSERDLQQIHFDLSFAKYRVFDWLAMGIGGRIENDNVVKVFVYSFLKVGGVPSKFIEDLQTTDYDFYEEWREIILKDRS